MKILIWESMFYESSEELINNIKKIKQEYKK